MKPQPLPGRVLVFGSGSIACRHVRLWRELQPDVLVARMRLDRRPPADPHMDDLVDQVFDDWEVALAWGPHAAVVANAAPGHVPATRLLVEAGVPAIVEKPLAIERSGLAQLCSLAKEKNAVILVGYCLRHHPLVIEALDRVDSGVLGRVLGVRAVAGQHIEGWRTGRDSAQTVTARSELGGGAIFELSHEVELCIAAAGGSAEVGAQVSRTGATVGDVEDIASLTLKHRQGAVSTISLNLLERPARRTFTVLGEQATVHVDLIAGWSEMVCASGDRVVSTVPTGYSPDDLYRAQLAHFGACIDQAVLPLVPLEVGAEVADVCIAAHEAAVQGRVVVR